MGTGPRKEHTQANVPILTLYLALVTAGLTITGRRQGRPWLGYAALAFGFLWGTALLTSSFELIGDLLALGLYVAMLGTVLPLLAGADRRWARLAAGSFASLQLAVLIDLTGQDPLTWGLYLVLGAGLAVLSWRGSERIRCRAGAVDAGAVDRDAPRPFRARRCRCRSGLHCRTARARLARPSGQARGAADLARRARAGGDRLCPVR